jgi:hypothetical protein
VVEVEYLPVSYHQTLLQHQGHNVVVNQKKGNWMTDNGSDGGMVIW